MREAIAIAAAIVLVAVMGVIIWAHELARPTIQINRELAAEADEEGD